MKIKLNKIEFDVLPVPSALREALLADEIITQGVSRDVWRWDQAAQTGHYLVQVTQQKAVPLGNGLSFFVPKAGTGVIERADSPTTKMGQRFLEAVGGKSVVEVMQALNKIVNLPQRRPAFTTFAPLNPVASYTIRQNVDFAVVQLANAARNLSAYLFVPGQVLYQHSVTEVADQAAYDAVMEANPKLVDAQPGFVLPPGSQANMMIRRLAMLQRLTDLQIGMAGQQPIDLPMDDPRRALIARLGIEWRVLAPPKPGTAPAAPVAPVA
jgi:hypothetical protein